MLYKDITASLLRFCSDFTTQHPDMEVVNFDAHADEGTLPATDVVGLSSVTIGVDEELCDIGLMFGISTRDDTNLFRLNGYMDKLFQALLPTEKIALYNSDTGAQIGWMVVENGTRALAVGGSAARPLQYIMVNLASTRTFG